MPKNPNIVMYSSNMCPFCFRAKRLLESKNVTIQEIIVDNRPNIRAEMIKKSGRRTVPQIWINNVHVGGCDELMALERSQKLNALLEKV